MDESDLALARYLRAVAKHLVDEVASALMWASGAVLVVALVIWAVTIDFPGRLLAGVAALLIAGLYLGLRTGRVPEPERWSRAALLEQSDSRGE